MYYFFSSISFEFSQSKIFFVELQGSGMAETFWASSMTSHESLSLFLCINLSCEFSNFFSKWSTPFQSSIILVWITTVQVWLSFLHCHEFNMVPVEDVSFKALMISGEKVDQVYCRLFQLLHIMHHLFPYAFPFVSVVPALVAGWCRSTSVLENKAWHTGGRDLPFSAFLAGLQEPPEAIGYFGSTVLSAHT